MSGGRDRRAYTPGPWQWSGNARNNDVYLVTVNRGRQYVMGFDRWGMRGAQPRFQPEGRGLVPASDLLMFEVGDKSVRGVAAAKADASVYRLDIRGIDCADANLIAAAPTMADALLALAKVRPTNWHDDPDEAAAWTALDDALAAAGITP